MRVTKIISHSAGLDGLHLTVDTEEDMLTGSAGTIITFPLSEMTNLLNGIALAATVRETLAKAAIHVTDRHVCPHCGSNQFRDRQLLTTNAECIRCGKQFRFSVGAEGPQGEKP